MLETAVGSKSETFVWPETARLNPGARLWGFIYVHTAG